MKSSGRSYPLRIISDTESGYSNGTDKAPPLAPFGSCCAFGIKRVLEPGEVFDILNEKTALTTDFSKLDLLYNAEYRSWVIHAFGVVTDKYFKKVIDQVYDAVVMTEEWIAMTAVSVQKVDVGEFSENGENEFMDDVAEKVVIAVTANPDDMVHTIHKVIKTAIAEPVEKQEVFGDKEGVVCDDESLSGAVIDERKVTETDEKVLSGSDRLVVSRELDAVKDYVVSAVGEGKVVKWIAEGVNVEGFPEMVPGIDFDINLLDADYDMSFSSVKEKFSDLRFGLSDSSTFRIVGFDKLVDRHYVLIFGVYKVMVLKKLAGTVVNEVSLVTVDERVEYMNSHGIGVGVFYGVNDINLGIKQLVTVDYGPFLDSVFQFSQLEVVVSYVGIDRDNLCVIVVIGNNIKRKKFSVFGDHYVNTLVKKGYDLKDHIADFLSGRVKQQVYLSLDKTAKLVDFLGFEEGIE